MKYFLRAVKYLVKLAALLVLIFALMKVSGTSNIESTGGIVGFFESFFATQRGQIFAVALLVWSVLYPAVEFRRRHLSYELSVRREAIIKALRAGGMRLAVDEGGRMVFRSEGLVRSIWWLGDDAVTITANTAGGIDIEGPRRFVMEAEHRIPNYVQAEKENE
ncbi:MAG: hypothetical protein LBU97_03615 [Alistipes sp.]|jgi:hypothetical protein|nr:hypothetical protein [Alistipes sp.]